MTTKREKRREEIEALAFDLLEEEGFEGTSMKAIAARARASMETLYNWYGDKLGLFAALVERNTGRVLKQLSQAGPDVAAPEDRLRMTAETLLAMLSSPQAIALNRAAILDTTGRLGLLLTSSGREVVGPHLAGLLIDWRETGAVDFDDPRSATATFVNLLVGDHQIRRATHAEKELTSKDVSERTERALRQFASLYRPDQPA